jgi:glutamine amidotransferase
VLVEKTPILGICLGMQLFAKSSTEGNADGLGWLNAEVQRFDFSQLSAPPRIPHVGWNTVNIHKTSILFEGVQSDQRFYFTHSYHLTTPDQDIVLATTTYGYPFISAVQSENIYGVQFHPEKSHRRGLIVYQNLSISHKL